MEIKLLVEGGEMKPGPALSQKIGPLGLNLGKIISDVNRATADFKGIKVPITLNINTKTKEVSVKVSTPPTSELLKKEFAIQKGSPQPNNIKVANAAMEHIIKIAKIKQPDMLVDSFKAAVKSVVGSCNSIGILVESKEPKIVMEEIDKGIYNSIIDKGNEIPSKEKLEKLAKDFEIVKKKQEAFIKELEKKAEEKAAATARAAAGAVTAEGAAPSIGTTTPAKAEEKKK
ncbi:MAG: 50S ribosomal protein L11 [Candidatus Pacearchaeota archaeon]